MIELLTCGKRNKRKEENKMKILKKILTVIMILVTVWVFVSYANILCTNLSTHGMASWNIMNVLEKVFNR